MTTTTETHLPYSVKSGTPVLRVPPGVAVPKPVAAAAKVVDARAEALRAASVVWRERRDALRAAPALDKAAAAASAASGEPLPALVVPRAQGALAEAERVLNAQRTALNRATVELANQIREHRPAWMAAQEDAVEELRERARVQFAELGEALDSLADERAILSGLQDFPVEGSLGGLDLVTPGARKRYAEAQARLAQEIEA